MGPTVVYSPRASWQAVHGGFRQRYQATSSDTGHTRAGESLWGKGGIFYSQKEAIRRCIPDGADCQTSWNLRGLGTRNGVGRDSECDRGHPTGEFIEAKQLFRVINLSNGSRLTTSLRI